MSEKLLIDNKEIMLENLSDNGKQISKLFVTVTEKILAKNNELLLIRKARNAFILELKQSLLNEKGGL